MIDLIHSFQFSDGKLWILLKFISIPPPQTNNQNLGTCFASQAAGNAASSSRIPCS